MSFIGLTVATGLQVSFQAQKHFSECVLKVHLFSSSLSLVMERSKMIALPKMLPCTLTLRFYVQYPSGHAAANPQLLQSKAPLLSSKPCQFSPGEKAPQCLLPKFS